MKLIINSDSPVSTELIGKKIGEQLKGGEIIELNSELGGGKTTFARGLAEGIKSKDIVASPTFTISKVYNGQKINIHHFDLYRLDDPGLIKYEISDVLDNKKNVVVIEWPDMMAELLPKKRLKIEFYYVDKNKRKILFTYPESLSYLLNNYVDTTSKN